MKKMHISIVLLLFSICFNLSAQETFGLLWKPAVVMDNQLFPSYIWANSTRNYIYKPGRSLAESERNFRGDPEGQIGVSFTNLNRENYRIKIVIECNDIMNTSSYETFVDQKLTYFEIFPEIDFKWETLKNNRQPRPITLKFSVLVNGKPSGNATKTITLRSINQCPYTFLDKKGEIVDLNFMYAAYVNENHPRITNEILPEIIKQGMISRIVGYQADKKTVYNQVFAVWHYLKSRNIVYSSLESSNLYQNDMTYPFVRSQYVRTFDDALNTSQANCVDGTVAMASIIYKMGIQPFIAITPNHCFLGFVDDQEKGTVGFLETTMLGEVIEEAVLATTQGHFPEIFSRLMSLKAHDSYRSFLLAINQGTTNYVNDEQKFNSYNIIDKITLVTKENRNDLIKKLQYQLFAVDRYRREGLLPIAGN